MKTFAYTLPGTVITFPKAVLGPKSVVVINGIEGTFFGDWPIYESEAKLNAGDPPIGKITRTFAGEEAQALKAAHPELLEQIFAANRTIGEGVVGAA